MRDATGAIIPPVIIRKSLLPEPCNPLMTHQSPGFTDQFTSSTTMVFKSRIEPTDTPRISMASRVEVSAEAVINLSDKSQ